MAEISVKSTTVLWSADKTFHITEDALWGIFVLCSKPEEEEMQGLYPNRRWSGSSLLIPWRRRTLATILVMLWSVRNVKSVNLREGTCSCWSIHAVITFRNHTDCFVKRVSRAPGPLGSGARITKRTYGDVKVNSSIYLSLTPREL